jgi:RNA polymerase-interacting CarD/CdnL/TRCF family regulator
MSGKAKRREQDRRRLAYSAKLTKDRRFGRQGRWVMSLNGDVQRFELSTSVPERMRGMLFRKPDEVTRLLVPCHDIHTFGMRHELDIAFISKTGQVLEVHRKVAGKRRLKRKGASMVAERFSQEGDWLKAGDLIRLGASYE